MEQRNSKKRKRPEQNLGEPRRRRRGLDSFFSYLESLMENLPEDARRDLQERLLQIVLDAVRRHQALSPPPAFKDIVKGTATAQYLKCLHHPRSDAAVCCPFL
ncbi:uncharacterized protein LOC112561656 [Pomacea canaliculata]|uniref:uncharacterized protein LOC112561656 n=1 Tax=Pomacea canaliculata TaxID=400727 RepID=UPI000D72BA3F|nr:uncharacterized protein LOC112561656 [Pomacea canaliculata]